MSRTTSSAEGADPSDDDPMLIDTAMLPGLTVTSLMRDVSMLYSSETATIRSSVNTSTLVTTVLKSSEKENLTMMGHGRSPTTGTEQRF